jgi:hypothetical protein
MGRLLRLLHPDLLIMEPECSKQIQVIFGLCQDSVLLCTGLYQP